MQHQTELYDVTVLIYTYLCQENERKAKREKEARDSSKVGLIEFKYLLKLSFAAKKIVLTYLLCKMLLEQPT